MSERRCPNCGGLVGADAEWCTQCFARLTEPEAAGTEQEAAETEQEIAAPAATEGVGLEGEATGGGPPEFVHLGPQTGIGAGLHAKGESIVWDCAMCGTENPIDAATCSACGTRFGQIFEEPEEKPSVDPGRAAMFSLFFPGAGHFVAGRRGEGFARAVVFAFALMLGIFSIGPARAGSGGPYMLMMVVSLAFAAGVYVTSTADAGREARGEKPILSMRMLLYGAVGLMFAAIAILTMTATSARG
ncbi:MAG: hypothetical protein ACRDHM_00060 [Actinomycetota bacterium]